MAIQKVDVKLQGISPLLMHSFPMVPIEAVEKKTPEEQAELATYRDPDSNDLYIPGINLQRAFVSGATYSKGKGRASLQKPTAACLQVTPERVSLGTKEYSVDSRPVVIPATKGRIMRHRPRLNDWEISFAIEFDDTLLTVVQLRRIVDDTCSRVGFLDFRPEKKGPFGRAMVIHWSNGKRKEQK